MMIVEHPVAVITGVGAGIGRACAVRFAREGARAVVVDRTDEDGIRVNAVCPSYTLADFHFRKAAARKTACGITLGIRQ